MASKAEKTGLTSALAVLFAVGMAIIPTQNALATTSLACKVGTDDVLDVAPLSLGAVVNCDSSTTNSGATNYQLEVTDGTGSTVYDSTILAYTTGTTVSTGPFTVNNVGVWEVSIDYFNDAGAKVGQELINIEVSFQVIPESSIGAAALIASSLAALGAFVGIRNRRVASITSQA